MKYLSIPFIFLLLFAACEKNPRYEYVAKCQPLCDDEKGLHLDREKFLKYKRWYPYDTVQKFNKDSTFISFDFIADCCLEFTGSIDQSKDTLILYFGYPPVDTFGACDCYCDYRMIYRIKRNNMQWSTLKILNTDGNKPYEKQHNHPVIRFVIGFPACCNLTGCNI